MSLIAFLFNWFVKITGWIPQLIIFKIKVFYEDRSVSKRIKGKAIVISNHNYLLDFGLLLFVFWRRTLRCAVAEVMYEKRFFMSIFLKLLGCIKVNRNSHDFTFLDKCKDVLDKGGVVEIFPEGRLPKEGDELPLPFNTGYVHLALESGAPIIPVYNNAKLFAREHTKVVIGKPINVSDLYDTSLSERENITKINDIIRSKIIELGKELERKEI